MKKNIILIMIFAISLISSNGFSQLKAKSPGTATVLSVLLPGAGHIYADESDKGWILMGAYTGAMGLVIAYGPWTWEEEEKGDPFFSDLAEGTGTPTSTKVIWYASAAVAAATWIYAVVDAGPAVKRYNERFNLSITPSLKNGNRSISLLATINF